MIKFWMIWDLGSCQSNKTNPTPSPNTKTKQGRTSSLNWPCFIICVSTNMQSSRQIIWTVDLTVICLILGLWTHNSFIVKKKVQIWSFKFIIRCSVAQNLIYCRKFCLKRKCCAWNAGLAELEAGPPLEFTLGSILSHAVEGSVFVSENLFIFVFAAVGLDYCFKMRLLSPFPIKR